MWSTLLGHPSGLLDYLAGLITQCDANACLGGLVALIEAVMIFAATLLLVRKTAVPHAGLVCLIPLGLWLVLQNVYDAPIHAISLKLLAALWGAGLALAVGPFLVPAIPLIAFVLLWACGIIPGLVFLLTVAAFMLLFRRWAWLLVTGLTVAVALFSFSFLARRSLFSELQWSDARLPVSVSCAFYLCVPLALFSLVYLRLRGAASPEGAASDPPVPRLPIAVVLGVQAAFLLATGTALWLTFNARERAIVRVDVCARQGDWAGVLATARHIPNSPAATRLDVHRALFHSGGLGDTLFSVAQLKEQPLIPGLLAGSGAYLPISELWLELGLVSAAQHYASEALELRGPRPWILRQLARICLLKDQPLASRVFLNRLKAFPSQRDWAERRLVAIDSGVAPPDEDLAPIRRLGLSSDLVSNNWAVPEFLHHLLQANRTNRMAFEFLIAHYLLSFQLEQFVVELDHLDAFNDQHLPRHYEEALLLYLEDPRGPRVDLKRRSIRPETLQRFARFKAILRQQGLKSAALEPALVPEFGDSLWFYYLFGHTSPPGAAHPS